MSWSGSYKQTPDPEPLFCVGELVRVIDHNGEEQPELWRVQQVMYRSWYDPTSGRYRSGYGYKLPVEGPTGHYWMENVVVKPPASLTVAWKDCIFQPTDLNKGE